jgi:ferredoxin-NADP reductase
VLAVPGWLGHLAGQHVDVRLTAADGYSTQRSYSLAAPPDADRVELTVQRVPDGEVSPYLTEGFALGSQLEIRGPIGGWFVWRSTDPGPVLLVAGGSGIVPLMAMIRARRASASRTPFRLVYSLRTPADLYYPDELRHPPPGSEGLDVTYVFTRAVPTDWPTSPRRISIEDITAAGLPPEVGPTCFVCGPTSFVESVANMLVALGYDASRVKTERFGPSGG